MYYMGVMACVYMGVYMGVMACIMGLMAFDIYWE